MHFFSGLLDFIIHRHHYPKLEATGPLIRNVLSLELINGRAPLESSVHGSEHLPKLVAQGMEQRKIH